MQICDNCLAVAVTNNKVLPSATILGPNNIRWKQMACECCGKDDQCSFHPQFDADVAKWVKKEASRDKTFDQPTDFNGVPPTKESLIHAKLAFYRYDLSCLTAEERAILSADGVAKLRGPLEIPAAKVSKIGNVTDEEFKARGEELNRIRISRGYAAIRAHDEAAGTENDGLEERLTALLANLMHVCQSTGQPEIFMRALHMANSHFAAEINQD